MGRRSSKPFWARDYKKAAYNRQYYRRKKAEQRLSGIVGIAIIFGGIFIFSHFDGSHSSKSSSGASSLVHPAVAESSAGLEAFGHYNPDFDCHVDHSKDSIATMLCENSNAAKHELIFDQTYYALRQIVGKAGWKTLKQQAISDDEALKACIDPSAHGEETPKADPDCYISKMAEITDKYKTRLSGAPLEEANRDINEHIKLQQQLINLGYMPAGSVADGVYGESTRAAIIKWQKNTGDHNPTGFLSDDDATKLMTSSAAVHVTSKNKPEYTSPVTPAHAQESSKSFLWMIILTVLVMAFIFFRHKARKNEYEATWDLIRTEIYTQKKNLQIARTQKLTADAYGTVDVTKWAKEINYFINTRISPIISPRIQDEKRRDKLRVAAGCLIEQLASEPLEAGTSTTVYRSDPTVFDPRMDPFDYEQYCALLLKNAGWNAQATKQSGDQGADVIAQKEGLKIVVQCKLYSGTVGNAAVQQVYTAKTHQGAQAAIVVTNSTFSASAREAAATTGVYLIHHAQLVDTADEIFRHFKYS
ncbi:restriction endonuclease [Acetobacter sp. AAB5]|uniref:restriction endonuclease n=1 Tax=Acetobacter sp. AAB5 TaxID=3418370 RepID=UPI003CED6106